MRKLRVLLLVGWLLAIGPAACQQAENGYAGRSPAEDVPPDFTPEGCTQGEFNPYWGVLHAHTGYSDGKLTPADAFAYGRHEGGLDMLIITDHNEMLYLPFPVGRKWLKCREQADAAYEPGAFLADCGLEYGSGFAPGTFDSTGHNNVFFTEKKFPVIQFDFHDFYQSLVDCPACIGQFNHPGDPTNLNWNNFEYSPEVDAKMQLFEFNSDPAWDLFFAALDAGWHVSPTNNQDNHSADWGTRNGDRSGLYLSELTREHLREAMLERRSFMSSDRNAAVEMKAFGKCWMGSILSGAMPPNVTLKVEAFDLDPGDDFADLQIYGPGQQLLARQDCGAGETCAAAFQLEAREKTYFVALAAQADGDWLVSAPIWVEPE